MASVLLIGLATVGVASALGAFNDNIRGGHSKQTVHHVGKKLDDLRVLGSEYGAPIPVCVGTLRLAGQMIWCTEIIEEENVRSETNTVRSRSSGKDKGKGGGKKGSRSSTHTTTTTWTEYEYFANFAIAFAAGPALDVLRIWADGNLIFDKSGQSEIMSDLSLEFRFYKGDETQLPDGLIEESVEGEQAPAHRGLVYIVFERLPLKQFGGRIPSITAEIAFAIQDNRPKTDATWISADPDYQAGNVSVSPTTNSIFIPGDGYDGAYELSLHDMTEIRFIPQDEMTTDGEDDPMHFYAQATGANGYVYGRADGSNSTRVWKFDPVSGKFIDFFGTRNTSLSMGVDNCTSTSHMVTQMVVTILGTVAEALVCLGTFGKVLILNTEDMSYVWHTNDANESGLGVRIAGAVPGMRTINYSEVYYATSQPADPDAGSSIYKIRINSDGGVDFITLLRLGSAGADQAPLIVPESPVGTEVGHCKALLYDASDNTIIFHVSVDGTGYWCKWREVDETYVWAVEGNASYYSDSTNENRVVRSEFVSDIDPITKRSTSTGQVTYEVDWEGDAAFGGYRYYEGESDSVVIVGSSGAGVTRLYLSRGAGDGNSLAATITTICGLLGLAPEDIDVSDLPEVSIPGYPITDLEWTARDALQVLAQVFGFEAVESDYKIKFVQITKTTPVATLEFDSEYSDLVFIDTKHGKVISESRERDTNLPQFVSIVFFDPDRDYQAGEQHAQRPLYPVETTNSKKRVQIDLKIAITAQTALDAAWRILWQTWVGRVNYSWAHTWAYIALDPLDVIQINVGSSARLLVRITETDIGGNMKIECSGEAAAPPSYQTVIPEGEEVDDFIEAPTSQYEPEYDADNGSGYQAGSNDDRLAIPGSTRLVLIDCPLILDLHSSPDRSTVYMCGSPLNPTRPWGGATIGFSRDGETWQVATTITAKAGLGSAVNALGAPSSPYKTDNVNTLTIAMRNRTDYLESVPQLSMLNGANVGALIRRDGGVELIQFRDVTVNDNGTFTLSGLLRGRRGTEVYCEGHTAGELFVLIDGAWLDGTSLAYDDLNTPLQWMAVTDGQPLIDIVPQSFTYTGRDLKPYAPVHINGERDGSSNLTITWVRRTRIGGSLKNGTGTVPLSETSESYEVDIMDGSSVVRTIDSLASPTASYTAAQQVSDFGSVQDTVNVVVYQISSAIGRGFPGYGSV